MHAAAVRVPASLPEARRPAALDQAVARFEALFVGTLLREALAGEGLLADGPGREVLRGLVEDTLSEQIARTGAFGVGAALRREFERPTPLPTSDRGEDDERQVR